VAKVASDHGKPGGLVVVQPGEEQGFLAPLPVRVLWGVGQVTEVELSKLGIKSVGELAQVSEETLRSRFGKRGVEMAQQARGIDERPVVTEHELKSSSEERTFAHDIRDAQVLRRQIGALSQGVARRLKDAGLAAGTISIKLRYADFTTLTRQMKLAMPTDDERVIYRAALALVRRAWDRKRSVRLLGVGGQQLTMPVGQLALL
jgi:DNA polymerase-4